MEEMVTGRDSDFNVVHSGELRESTGQKYYLSMMVLVNMILKKYMGTRDWNSENFLNGVMLISDIYTQFNLLMNGLSPELEDGRMRYQNFGTKLKDRFNPDEGYRLCTDLKSRYQDNAYEGVGSFCFTVGNLFQYWFSENKKEGDIERLVTFLGARNLECNGWAFVTNSVDCALTQATDVGYTQVCRELKAKELKSETAYVMGRLNEFGALN